MNREKIKILIVLCAEPGEYTYDTSTEPSIFAGSLGQSILDTFKTVGKRFAYGGDTGEDQRVYGFNTKEIMDNHSSTHTSSSGRSHGGAGGKF